MKVDIHIVIEDDNVSYKQETSPDVNVNSLLMITDRGVNVDGGYYRRSRQAAGS